MDAEAKALPAKVTILVDDQAATGLEAEHGFAAWIETPQRKLLFDTGKSGLLFRNAAVLGLDLCSADALVLSHGHYDHTGGLAALLAKVPALDVYCHPAVLETRYSLRGGVAKPIDLPAEARSALQGLPASRVHWGVEPVALGAGIGLTGFIPRQTSYEDTGGPFFLDAAGSRADPLDDDLALWLRTPRGLVVVVGCSHAGLVNTLHQALRASGESRLHAVLGGFHLREASGERLERTTRALRELGPELIVPCHCTGEQAVVALRRDLGSIVVPGSAGVGFSFG